MGLVVAPGCPWAPSPWRWSWAGNVLEWDLCGSGPGECLGGEGQSSGAAELWGGPGSRSLPWCAVPHPEDDFPTVRGTHVSAVVLHSPKLFLEGSPPRSPSSPSLGVGDRHAPDRAAPLSMTPFAGGASGNQEVRCWGRDLTPGGTLVVWRAPEDPSTPEHHEGWSGRVFS